MVSKKAANSPRTGLRRSSRLSQGKPASATTDAQDPPVKRRRLSHADPLESCSARATSGRRGKLTHAEVLKREKRVAKLELDYQERSEELKRRYASLIEREKEVATALDRVAERDAQSTLSQLQELFTCPLCYEVLTVPYSLNPSLCGHTFCGICILKWFFSRLHEPCGGWHESVDCPICRQLLVITPDRTPRLEFTCPFVPNRVAATACETLVERLTVNACAASSARIKLELSEGPLKSRLKRDCEERSHDRLVDDGGSEDSVQGLEAWTEGGSMRTEWLRKQAEGKQEMNELISKWTTLKSPDFIRIKRRLGV
ncbi:hypothetical protein K525DRAFT_256980 [Schizophyllum commune Loenen D]|nr:hypothetical protein K525DRAFT_256980 [Schizophyllum commune Loenen D]